MTEPTIGGSEKPRDVFHEYEFYLIAAIGDAEENYEFSERSPEKTRYHTKIPKVLEALSVALRGIIIEDTELFIYRHYPMDDFLPYSDEIIKRLQNYAESVLGQYKVPEKEKEGFKRDVLGRLEHLVNLVIEKEPLTKEETERFHQFINSF